jgi:hypothetical protein
MTTLAVREMVLYKHGVGFFVRGGAVEGESLALNFRQDEINDVLKSLTVFDQSGGQVLGIHYGTPMDAADRLANSSIRLSDRASLRDLLRDLRGRSASLTFETTPGTRETVSGRVIGLDEAPDNANSVLPTQPIVSIAMLTPEGVRVFPFDGLRGLTIHDTQSEHDLRYFLDTSMSESTSRTVNVRLSAGAHDLVVYYVAPSPTWRVSYRFVGETDENAETGKGVLQGWGLFDNRLEEDLDSVRVTLVAGQPISFIYDLYASRIPARPTVQDETRVAPGPVEYRGKTLVHRSDRADIRRVPPPPSSHSIVERFTPQSQMDSAAFAEMDAYAVPPDLSADMLSQTAAAETKDSGEFFQYTVTAPVSVKRGESALVPIIGAEISYNRELLYNRAKLPNHPVAALRFPNTTGLTLERGPVTVVEDGDYKGEAVIAFTKADNEVYLPYAVELGVRVVEHPISRTETAGLNIQGRYLVYEEYQVRGTTYFIENTAQRALKLMIEAPVLAGWEIFDTPAPDVANATEQRWRVTVAAGGKAEFVRLERQRTRRYEELLRLNYAQLQDYLNNRWLDSTTFNQLHELLDKQSGIVQAKAQKEQLTTERDALYKKQEQLRANLTTLQPSGQEGALRRRMLGQLEETQNRLEAIDAEMTSLTTQIATAEAKIEDLIRALS